MADVDAEKLENFCPKGGNPTHVVQPLTYSLYQLNYSSYSIAVSKKQSRNNSGPQNWSSHLENVEDLCPWRIEIPDRSAHSAVTTMIVAS
jgi:hypothetical protein